MGLKLKIWLRYAFSILMFILMLWCFNEFSSKMGPVILDWNTQDNNIACHDSYENDALISANAPIFLPKQKSIFFHETSCRGGIDSMQACSLESAARKNPTWDVYLLFNSPVSNAFLKYTSLAKLLKFPNIKIARVHANEYSKNLEINSVVTGALKRSRFPIEHTAEIMKLLTLNKFGGMALDLRLLVVKSLDKLPENWLLLNEYGGIAAEAMGFSKLGVGKYITHNILQAISKEYYPNNMRSCTEMLGNKVREICTHQIYEHCKVEVLNHTKFYPLDNSKFKNEALRNSNNIQKFIDSGDFYTINWWKIRTTLDDNKILFKRLGEEFCPSIYEMHGKLFGV